MKWFRLTKFSKLPGFENVFVELVVVGNGKYNLVQPFQLLQVVGRDVAKFYRSSDRIKIGFFKVNKCD